MWQFPPVDGEDLQPWKQLKTLMLKKWIYNGRHQVPFLERQGAACAWRLENLPLGAASPVQDHVIPRESRLALHMVLIISTSMTLARYSECEYIRMF